MEHICPCPDGATMARRSLPTVAILYLVLTPILLAPVGCRLWSDSTGTAGRAVTVSLPQDEEDFDELDNLDEEDEEEISDPLRGYNRFMFVVNDKLYFWVLKPVAQGYEFVLPEPVRVAVGRAYKNLRTPPRFANSVFQLEFGKAGAELGRLLVNTTVGIGGLFDPAEAWLGWRAPGSEDFGQSLAVYGVGSGFPIVLPLLGPSNIRDGLGHIPDVFMDPTFYFLTTWQSFALSSGQYVNRTSLHIGEYESLKEDALDPYTFFRNAYREYRRKQIEE